MKPDSPTTPPVAIIGMGCFFPKAAGPREFWRLLSRGQDAIDEVPDTHWRSSDYYDPNPKTPDHVYCTRGGYLSPVDFDPTEFGIPPTTLEATDTSQLLGLVAAKAALADAGYDDSRPWDRSRTGVILGVTGTQELVIPLGARLGHPIWRRALKEAGVPADQAEEVVRRIADGYVPWQEASFPGLLGNVVAGRISNRLDLGGTNCAVDAACASSMSAMHLALMELYAGRNDMVVTGGVDTLNDIFMHMCFTATPILSPTGDVRPFSKDADGSLLGEGVGIVILKRLDAAERDGDRVYAVIRALGSGSDGRSNSIYAPHVEGQKKAILAAYAAAGVPTDSVGLVEAHGTGTRVGDRVEFAALKQVFGEGTSRRIAVGSVKSMIGHTKAAAGAAGLIKTALCLYHKVLPPSLKVGEPDPGLELETGPLYLNTATRPWISADGAPRRAGVSSFGFGGSNFHMVLEEYESEKSSVSWDGSVEIFALSGADRTTVALELDDIRKALKQADAGAVSRIAARSRKAFSPDAPCRLLVVLEKTMDRFADPETALRAAADRLSGAKPGPDGAGGVFLGEGDAPGPIGFLYPGQGSQYVGMGRDLVCRFPEALDALARAGSEVSDAVFPEPALTPESAEAQAEALRRTDRAQPAIGAISLAMTRILEYFGIRPGAAAGHSFGELCALFAAGWIDAPTLLRLALARGRLMAEAGGPEAGSMLAVAAPLDAVARWIEEQELDLVLANRNGPEQGVLSGPAEAIDRAETLLKAKGWRARRLPVSAAFHSRLMTDARKPFAEILAEAEIAPTETPVYSNATGEAYPRNAAEVRRLLAEQLVSPVEFVKEIAALFQAGVRTFVEIGPKTVLGGLVRAILKGEPVRVLAVDGSGGKGFGMTDLARLLCGLAALGYPVRLDRWERPEPEGRSPRMRIPLTGANYRSPRKEAGKRPPGPSAGGPFGGGSGPGTRRKKSPTTAAETTLRVHASMNASRAAGGNGGNRPGKSAGEPVSEIAETPTTAPTCAAPFQCRESAAVSGMEARAVRFPPPPAEIPATFDRIGSTAAPKPTNPPAAAPGLAAGKTASPRDAGPSTSSAPTEDSSLRQPPNRDDQRHPAASVQPSVESHMTRNQNPPTETEPGRRSADLVADAFEAVREGLRAMQSLQARTAETHSKFLETQAEANRTLQAMMVRTQRLAEAGLGLPPDGADSPPTVARRTETEAPADPISPEVPELPPEAGFEPISPVPATRSVDPPIPAPEKSAAPARPSMPEASPVPAEPASIRSVQSGRSESGDGPARDELAAALVAVVSEQTGYPEEMLSLEMEIEADLGIDSIKRVEILGAFEEKMPGLPPVSPEIMGTLRTLDQILDHLLALAGPPEPERREASPASGSFATEPAGASAMASSDLAAPAGFDAGARDRIAATLVAVVSEQTGYPEEMLSLEMEIEADLGIDSIKRVEILGAFEERMPELPPVSPEIMGTLKTLEQIVAHLSSAMGSVESEGRDAIPPTGFAEVGTTSSPAETIPDPDVPASCDCNAETRNRIAAALVDVVSEQTGYPGEMLSLEMEIEADLGIDSIKRVEILGAFEEKMPELPPVSPEIMGTLKTLDQIVAHLCAAGSAHGGGGTVARGEPVPSGPSASFRGGVPAPPPPEGLKKKVVTRRPRGDESGPAVTVDPVRSVFLAADPGGLARALGKALAARGMRPVVAAPADLLARDDLAAAGGLILIADAWPTESRGRDGAPTLPSEAFELARRAGAGLRSAGESGGALFATVTRLDGAFGFAGGEISDPYPGALAGLVKTAAAEWPGVRCRALDLSPDLDPIAAADALARLLVGAGPAEIGLDASGPCVLELGETEYPAGAIRLDPGDLVVVSGGGRGVTAAAVRALAETVPAAFLLLGRSPEPGPEPEWLAGLADEAGMKRAIFAHWTDGKPNPAGVESAFRRHRAAREIRETLDAIAAAGAAAIYRSVDVRDLDAVRAAVAEAKRIHGPVRALVHGAGHLADRLIAEKTPEQFASVFDTKVRGMEALLAATADDPLRYLLVFSSVAARSGNRGQADYAMANEVLNKMARREAFRRPDCRVVSFNWGPWDGGMVSPALRAHFGSRGIGLIPVADGVRAMLAEMAGSPGGEVEMVIGAELGVATTAPGVHGDAPSELPLAFKREIDPRRVPVTAARPLNGAPSMPFSLMAEWLGHGALHQNPGLFLRGLDEMRLLRDIRLDARSRLIRLMAGKARRTPDGFEAEVELRNGFPHAPDRVHSTARALLSDRPPREAPAFRSRLPLDGSSYGRSMAEVYDRILRVGDDLRGIREVRHCTPDGVVARLAPAPAPDRWMEHPLRSGWIGDPLAMDAAFQMAALWSFERTGRDAIPHYAAAYRQYRDRFPESGVTAVLEIDERADAVVAGDFAFLDDAGDVVATLKGFRATVAAD